MGGLTLTQREQARLQVLNRVLEGKIGVTEAACLLGLSDRHTWRILAAYRREGAASLAHGNRGRRPPNATPERVRQQVLTLAQTTYRGFNHTHLTEVLQEREGINLSRSTVRSILLGAGLKSPRHRRPPRHRLRRERMPEEGMLLQLDGSFHDWLEGRGPWLTLLIAVDDATGKVAYALFREQEDAYGYFLLLRGIIKQHGIPLAVYHDRHSALGNPAEEGRETQFARALRELGIRQIFARSPEAKGRVERVAGTFQDRLVSELRLVHASSLSEANRVLSSFIPSFNGRFFVPPVQADSAYRLLPREVDLDSVLCFKYARKVAKDNTVKYRSRTLQLLPEPGEPNYAGVSVEVQERLDGSLVVCYKGRVIPTREAPPRPGALRVCRVLGNEKVAALSWACMGKRAYAEASATREDAALGNLVQDRRIPWRPRQHPTPRQQARWDAVQAAREQGLSIRAISKTLGISRNTVRKYLNAESPPIYRRRQPSTITSWTQPETKAIMVST